MMIIVALKKKKLLLLLCLMFSGFSPLMAASNEAQRMALREFQIPEEVHQLLSSYPKPLSSAFREHFPQAVKKYQEQYLSEVYYLDVECARPASVAYGSETLKNRMIEEGIILTESEEEFLDSVTFIRGCGFFPSANPTTLLNALITEKHKKLFFPEIILFHKDGSKICETMEIDFLGKALAKSNSCFNVYFLPQTEVNFRGFYTWEIAHSPIQAFDPIYFRSTVVLARVNQNKRASLNYLVIARWKDISSLEKKVANHLIPLRTKNGFEYLQKALK